MGPVQCVHSVNTKIAEEAPVGPVIKQGIKYIQMNGWIGFFKDTLFVVFRVLVTLFFKMEDIYRENKGYICISE